jgi:hypothetical protein
VKFDTLPQQVLWFRDKYRTGSLILKPPFQRKPVWAAKQKCFLIESLLINVPVPEVFVQQTLVDGEAVFAVVDGQQRIRTILQFMGLDKDSAELEYNGFPLDKLKPTSQYKDLSFGELPKADRDRLLTYVFSVRFLEEEDDNKIRDLFVRLNKYLTKLSEQELRNATYTGPFVTLTSKLADDDYWFEQRLVSSAQIRRMKDVEFMSDLLIGVMHGPQGGSAKVLDEYFARYEDYDDEFPDQKRTVRRFQQALKTVQALFPELAETRWGNRTDFYTLFVAISALQVSSDVVARQIPHAREALQTFADQVNKRLANEKAHVPDEVIKYVRAVEKGANDKKRRADRHTTLLSLLQPYATDKKTS